MMADPSATPIEATTRPDAGRLFAALELGKSRRLVTVDAPGSDKLSRHAVAGGDGAALLDLLARLRTTAERPAGRGPGHPRGRARRFLAAPPAGAERDLEPCRRSRLDRRRPAASPGQDGHDRR